MTRAGPPAEVDVTEPLVRSLLASQHPDLAALPLRRIRGGWDNALVRIGDELLARLPRRALAAPMVADELRWLAALADRVPLPIPAPVRAGRPGDGYPWAWSIVRWLPGAPALTARFDRDAAVDTLAGFVRALHVPAPSDAPVNPMRGVPLVTRDAATRARLATHPRALAALLRTAWDQALAAAPHAGPPVLLHGDLHPGNLLVVDRRLAAVIDFGDVCGGDPAADLAVAWMLFDRRRRGRFLDAVGADAACRARARGWALSIGLAVAAAEGRTPLGRAARRTLGRAAID